MTRTLTRWRCPRCNQHATTYIDPTRPPVCASDRHPRPAVMIPDDDTQEALL